MQKISIKNLGPIKEFSSELLKMNLLIGEQATGKSTICKSVYFFRTIKDELVDYLYYIAVMGVSGSEQQRPGSLALIDVSDPEKQILNVLNQNLKKKFKQIFGFDSSSNSAMEMHYDYGADISMEGTIEKTSGDIAFHYSEKLARALKNLEHKFVGTVNLQKLTDFSFAGAERRRIHREIKNRVNAIFDDSLSTYYIPAGRQLLALLSAQKTQIDYPSIDFINREFMQFIESLQNFFEGGIKNAHEYYIYSKHKFDANHVAQNIIQALKGDYRLRGEREFLVIDDKHQIPFNYASSGQQESLWVFLQLYALMLREEPAFVIIEEPEAHIYPTLQHKVFEFITEFTNINNSSVLVTTHSPYILTSANVLYYGGRLSQYENSCDDLEKILSSSKYIYPDQFTAWKLNAGGDVESLVDEEYGDLRSSLIDEVSEEIDRLYTKLYYYEVEHEKEK
jgi:hypothetical protein